MLIEIILFSFLAGSTVFFGGFFSFFFEKKIKNQNLKISFIHFLTAFATGVMISAIAFVLVPKGLENLSILSSVLLFILGGVIFYSFDIFIEKNSANIPQVLAMLLDFIPESIALGAMFVYNHSLGILLALFIAVQNFPEAFNSYLELRENKLSKKKSLFILFLLSFIGLLFSLLGYYFLSQNIELTSALMIFSAGGILYLIFQDIAPSIALKSNKKLVLGVNLGFILGMLSHSFI